VQFEEKLSNAVGFTNLANEERSAIFDKEMRRILKFSLKL
jgi:hypothetical protein